MNSIEIEIGPHRFACLTAGDPGRPLLLFLHGFPEYSGAWEEMLERLSDAYFCVAPDQRGYGLSSKPEGVEHYAAGKLAADAAGIIRHFAPRAHAVIGHDWGASVAYALAIGRPEMMERLIIMNGVHPIPFVRETAAGGAQSEASQYFFFLRAEGAEAALSADSFAKLSSFFAKGMRMEWLAGDRLDRYREAWGRPGALTAMLNWYRASVVPVAKPGEPIRAESLPPLDPAALRVKPKHLLIWGPEDKALLPASTEGLEDLCDHLERAEVPGTDHWLHHQEPDKVAALIRDFCDRPV